MEQEFSSTKVAVSGKEQPSGNVSAPELPQKVPSTISLDTFESVVSSSGTALEVSTKRKIAEKERQQALHQVKFRYFCNKI